MLKGKDGSQGYRVVQTNDSGGENFPSNLFTIAK